MPIILWNWRQVCSVISKPCTSNLRNALQRKAIPPEWSVWLTWRVLLATTGAAEDKGICQELVWLPQNCVSPAILIAWISYNLFVSSKNLLLHSSHGWPFCGFGLSCRIPELGCLDPPAVTQMQHLGWWQTFMRLHNATFSLSSLLSRGRMSWPEPQTLVAWTSGITADVHRSGVIVSKRMDIILGHDVKDGKGE